MREARQFIETCERLRQSQKQKLADVLARGRAEFEDRLIKADDANRLIKLAQGIRIHEKNFMLRGDETALIEIDRTIDAIGELIDDLDQRFESEVNVAQLSAIRESARRYKLAFDAWVEDSQQKEEKMASMVLSARGMVEQCEALRSDQKRLTETSVGDAIQAIAGILALTILGGLLMGIAITRSIVQPLRGAAEFAGAVAEGDFDRSLRIDQRDEIGDLARSLDVMSGELAAREGEIVEAQQRGFRGIVEAFERGFFFYSTDERGHLTYISPSVANVIGWEPDEGTPHFRDLCTDSPINDEAKHRSEETLRGRTQSSFEVELATPDGRICRLEISEIPVTNDDGRVTEAQGIAHDVTTLIEARAAADQASRAKSAFLANMSHELRTPMNAIIGYSEMLMEDAEDSGDDAQLEDLRKIHGAGQYLLSLINDILDLSKVEAGRMDLYLERFDLAEMVEEIASTVAPLVEKQENTLVCEPAEGLGTMRADLTKVRQALFNLLSNAAKFTAKGTITLAARRDRDDAGDRIVMSVADTGIGIPPDKLEHIFDEFSQADQTTTRNFGGTGLGLAISRRFCRMMGGDITVWSRPGEGAVFTMTLPATVDALEVAKAAASDSGSEDGDGPVPSTVVAGAVLVIDDDPDARDLLRRTLEADGHEVVTAASARDGLELARAATPAVVTLDVSMPDMDGWTVLRLLKSDPALRHVPVVMVSMLHEKGLGIALGAAEYLSKPVDRKKLQELVARLSESETRGHVLVVEDDAAERELVRRALQQQGRTVVEAENGAVGMERVTEETPQVVILDLMMPVMDGFEFLRRLRASPAGRPVPVIVLTARELSADEADLLTKEASAVLLKDSPDLDAALSELRSVVAGYLGPGTAGG